MWDLRWGSSGASADIDDDDDKPGAPRGPRAVAGVYQLKLTIDGNILVQTLKVNMDPRSQATPAELNEQLKVALEIFGSLRDARKAVAEIASVKKNISEVPAAFLRKHQEMLAEVTNLNAQIERIEKGERTAPGAISGLESAAMGLNAALRVVENSDRAIPSQALDLYRDSDRVAKASLSDWAKLKANQLNKLNDSLKKAGMNTIQIAEIENEVEYLMSQ